MVGTSGSCFRRSGAGDREHVQLAVGDELRRLRVIVELGLHLARHQVGQRRRRAAIGHVGHLELLPEHQQFHRDVRQRAVAGRGDVDLVGVLAGVVDEALEARDRQRRMRHQQHRHLAHVRHRPQILFGVVRHGRAERRVDRVVGRREQERVAVGRRLGDDVAGDDAARAGLVVDQHLLAELGRQPLGQEARHDVRDAAGREGHDQSDRPLGILGPRSGDGSEGKAQEDGGKQPPAQTRFGHRR